MQRIQGYSRLDDGTGGIAPSATITVYQTGTGTLATIYGDDLPTPTVKANPFPASSAGYWFFYAGGSQRYDVQVSGGGITTPYLAQVDAPAGLGDGAVVSTVASGLPAGSIPHKGRLAWVTDGQGGLWGDLGGTWLPVLDYGFSSKAKAALPAAGIAGRLRRVTDEFQGLYLDDGAAWGAALGYAIPGVDKAGLPAAALDGRLRRVTDLSRGLWMDTGAGGQWTPISGGEYNVVEFGADPSGVTECAGDINAALNAAGSNGGGVVRFPPGTYLIASPLLIYDRVRLEGYGAVLQLSSSFVDDAVLLCAARDSNDLTITNSCGIAGLRVQLQTSPGNVIAMLDLGGMWNSRICDVTLIGAGVDNDNTPKDGTAVRLADNNLSNTSNVRSQGNVLENIRAENCKIGLHVAQLDSRTVDSALGALFLGLQVVDCGTGIEFTTTDQNVPVRLGVVNALLAPGLGTASTAVLGTIPLGVEFFQVDQYGFSTPGTYPGAKFSAEAYGVGQGASGTTAAAPLDVSGTAPELWTGSIYLKVGAGTVIAAGLNTYIYTMQGIPDGATLIATLVAGAPATPTTLQAAISGQTLTLTVVSAGLTLSADLVLRVQQVGP